MSDKLPVASCDLCRWWVEAYGNEPKGVCHHARVLERARVGYDWCNEFEHKFLGPRFNHWSETSIQQWRFPNE